MASKRASAVALALALSLAGAEARAADEAETKARTLFEVGGRAYDNGEFDVALQAFEQAHAIYPKDSLLFSMAQAHRRLFAETKDARNRDEALRLFREYLAKVKSGPRRVEANKVVGELEATSPGATGQSENRKKTRMYVASGTPGITVSVDGGPKQPANRTIEMSPGKHAVTLEADGFVTQKLDVELAPDEVLPLSRDLVELPAKIDIDTTGGASLSVDGRFVGDAPLRSPLELSAGEHFVAVELSGHETRSKVVVARRGKQEALDLTLSPTTQRYLSVAFIGTASASAVASGVFAGLAFAAQSDANAILEKQDDSGLVKDDLETYRSARAQRDRFVLGAGISGGVAGGLLVTGVVLFLADPAERAVPPRPSAPQSKPPPPVVDELAVVPVVSPEIVGIAAGARF
ncbi:MAG: PEGA domain-containing protein [Myxococcales bacterium]|nr:PEGA domain-containing protein [Myxococcales bacterium]